MSAPRVFISRPNVLTNAQRALEREWSAGIESLGFVPSAITRDEYQDVPWDQLSSRIGAANGAVILGLRDMHVEAGVRRPATPEERTAEGWYSTPWNHLEAGLAIMTQLPVLVAPEDGIADGIFASDVCTGVVRRVGIGVWREPGATERLELKDWAGAVRRHAQGGR
ncbi:MAG: hypothetical protein M3155_07045 [Actinomycetota bacterium]|nr:hypothetical protein [Actinomycetota bacterium]